MASVWNLVALSALKIRRIKAVLLRPSDKVYCSRPNGNRDRLTAIRPPTDFSIHKNRARCLLSNSKGSGLPATPCPCRGAGQSSEVGLPKTAVGVEEWLLS
ncbi:hypothetical protein NXV81_26750 [Bacteroides ovatus]|nr:hypothetical protein [Bacteroides ovatus]